MKIKLKKFPGESEPRVSSRSLADFLGLTHAEVLQLISENRAELERFGPVMEVPAEDEEEA
jgi:hypothetical protein